MPPATSRDQRRMRLYLVLALFIGLGFLAFLWISSHAYIEITVEGQEGGTASYTLIKQGTNDKTEGKNLKGTVKKLVSKGDYEVLVNQGSRGYLRFVTTGGFLSKTTVTAKLAEEKGRAFVGNNPKSCMHMIEKLLVTYDCGGTYKGMQTHVPASSTTPTYAMPIRLATEDVIEGLTQTKLGNIMLMRSAEEAEFGPQGSAAHSAYVLGADAQIADVIPLKNLSDKELYNLYPFKDGFLVVDRSFGKTFYYSALNKKPEEVEVDKPNNASFKAYGVDAYGDAFAVAYSGNKPVAKKDPKTGKQKTNKEASEVLVRQGDKLRQFSLGETLTSIHLCGKEKLCGLNANLLKVYDISGAKAKQLYALDNVQAIDVYGNEGTLVIVQDKNVLAIDLGKNEGTVQYNLDKFTFCGIRAVGDSYILCVENSKHKSSVLAIDQTKSSDQIDKKVDQIANLPDVKDVSAYGNFIFFNPDVGGLIYDKNLKLYTYDESKKQSVTNNIIKEVDRIGVDRNTYKLISTLN